MILLGRKKCVRMPRSSNAKSRFQIGALGFFFKETNGSHEQLTTFKPIQSECLISLFAEGSSQGRVHDSIKNVLSCSA